jgi:hypothetical protein
VVCADRNQQLSYSQIDIIDTEACSFLWFAAIQGIKREQDLTGLAPKGCFIAAQAIECEVG